MSHHNDGNQASGDRLELFEIKLILLSILQHQERIMSTLTDLSDALGVIDAKVAQVSTDVDTLVAKLLSIPTGGLTIDQQAALDAAVVHAQAIANNLSQIDTKAAQTTASQIPPPAPPAS